MNQGRPVVDVCCVAVRNRGGQCVSRYTRKARLVHALAQVPDASGYIVRYLCGTHWAAAKRRGIRIAKEPALYTMAAGDWIGRAGLSVDARRGVEK